MQNRSAYRWSFWKLVENLAGTGIVVGGLWLFANIIVMWLFQADIAEQKMNASTAENPFLLSIGAYILARLVRRGPRRFYAEMREMFF